MPKTAAQTTTDMAALPTTTISSTGTQVVTVELKFVGVSFVPANLRAALDAQYGTVALEDDGFPRPLGPFRFTIAP